MAVATPDAQRAPHLAPLAGPGLCLPSRLATQAVRALLAEADLTPKPGLVDQRGTGAHTDLSLELMHRSARSLFPAFQTMAEAALGQTASQRLRVQLAAIGRDGERAMLAATGGSNSHKGAIWALGLLVAGTMLCPGHGDPQVIAALAGTLASHPDVLPPQTGANGHRARLQYGVKGAVGEAQDGFPHVVAVGLPALLRARAQGVPEPFARLDALMAIMAALDDTCLLHRGGRPALDTAQRGARQVLEAGGTASGPGMAQLLALDGQLLALNASPGGSADLLAATLFLDSVARSSTQISPIHHFGDQ